VLGLEGIVLLCYPEIPVSNREGFFLEGGRDQQKAFQGLHAIYSEETKDIKART
jgi:hypothetical protein